MRINKALAEKGLCSRRKADELIQAKKIYINGALASPGTQVKSGDQIECKSLGISFIYEENAKESFYIGLNKPQGIISSCKGKNNLIDFLKSQAIAVDKKTKDLQKDLEKYHFYPVGRLDKESEGLIIITNDGDLSQKLSHPSFEHEKEYLVQCRDDIDEDFIKRFSAGLRIKMSDGSIKKTKACKAKKISKKKFTCTLQQGLNRQIRRMVAALGNKVERLARIRIAKLKLEQLSSGEFKLLNPSKIIDIMD